MSYLTAVVGLAFALTAFGEEPASREGVLGDWRVTEGATDEFWSIQSDGSKLSVTRKEEGKVTLSVECTANGSECEGIDNDKKAKFSMYFNGPILVQLETRGDSITKRKFVQDGDEKLTIDAQPMVGSGKAQVLKLTNALHAGK